MGLARSLVNPMSLNDCLIFLNLDILPIPAKVLAYRVCYLVSKILLNQQSFDPNNLVSEIIMVNSVSTAFNSS